MRQVIASGVVVLVAASVGRGQLVWESTFDTGTDGVVDLRTDNPYGTVMIGTNTGGPQSVLPITTQALGGSLSNKSGRATGATLGYTDSFSALYSFDWSLGALPANQGAGFFAGFTSASSQHSTRQFIGARFIRQVTAGGSNLVNMGGAWGSEGFTSTGRNFVGDVNLLSNLDGRQLQLAIGYDGASNILDVGLFDALNGNELIRSTGDIRTFENLGVPIGNPALNQELNALAVTHVGWTDFISSSDNVSTTWNMDSLKYYNSAAGAFDDVGPLPPRAGNWAGKGLYRFLVKVDPINIGTRASDVRPAELPINLKTQLQSQLGINGVVDMNSVQVIRYDPDTGQAFNDSSWAFGQSAGDRAFRWYDDAIPYEYPEVEDNIHGTNGVLNYVNRTRFGYFYDAEGNWESGRLSWTHKQEGNKASYYAVYFDTLPAGTEPWEASPRGLLGDGGMRTEPVGFSSTGAIHTRIDVTDWDGDGLSDIIAGNGRGGIAWYKNIGTAAAPDYGTSKILFTTDGKPIDVSWSSAPKVVDWDGDGVEDLITSGERNRMLWYKNVGTNTNRQFVYKGFITEGGQPLALPTTPNPEIPSITLDYYAITDVLDYDGDGDRDLIAGGYITGQLFFYKNTGTNPDGTPQLQLQGAIQADGAPIDTQWSAAPTFADFNNDGLVDIVVGGFPITPGGGDGTSSVNFLRYYVNIGTPTNPVYTKQTTPITGGVFPDALLSTPRAVDFNNDGLLDLIVSSNTQVYRYENVGTATSPVWAAHANPMPGKWGSAPLSVTQLLDWDGDGLLDRFSGYSVGLNTGQGNPGIYLPLTSLLGPGQVIDHSSGIGDDHSYNRMFDLDQNGTTDAMDADWDGKIWFHRNSGTNANPNIDTVGVIALMVDGNPIDVGPGPGADPFDLLQGSRAAYTVADFNQDGLGDLAIANYAGTVTYYDNKTASGELDPIFSLPDIVGELGIRAAPFAADWDNDGWIDIIAQATPDRFMFIRNLGVDINGDALFSPGLWINLPPAPYGAGGDIVVADFNGDGDDDLLLQTAYGFTTLIEASFLQNGYATATLIDFQKFTLPGDLDGDGFVGIADLNIVLGAWNQSVAPGDPLAGDPSGDGFVGIEDLNTVLGGWNAGTPPPVKVSGTIPEPGTYALFCAGVLLPISRRRTRRGVR
jgi:FG-GAP-like repeat